MGSVDCSSLGGVFEIKVLKEKTGTNAGFKIKLHSKRLNWGYR